MKTHRFLVTILACSLLVIVGIQAQDKATPMTTLAVVDQPGKIKKVPKAKRLVPNFALGQQQAYFTNLEDYIKKNLVYPENAQKYAIEGTVTVQIKGTSEGEIKQIKIIDSLGFGCDEAVMELLNTMPNWIPAYNYGIPVNWKQTVQFDFSLR